MHVDVVDLKEFYASALGRLVRRLVANRLRLLWPDMNGLSLAAIGYGLPYLNSFHEQTERTLVLMPARQGVVAWPKGAPSLAALIDETDLPLGDSAIDRLMLVHCLEMSENSAELLREAWRVLAPGGRLVVIVPNRRGLWARFEHTPFGHGRPYSRSQLFRLLRDAMFTPNAWDEALWMPPVSSRMLMSSAPAFERTGRIFQMPAGVLLVEATKQLYQAIPAKGEKVRKMRPVLVPGAAPSARMASR